MTQKDKELLLRDLCARLPYGVKVLQNDGILATLDGCPSKKEMVFNLIWENPRGYNLCQAFLGDFKPYLRPMSSMTNEEREFYSEIGSHFCGEISVQTMIAWLSENRFDYHGLIEMGLALEAPEGMYKTE